MSYIEELFSLKRRRIVVTAEPRHFRRDRRGLAKAGADICSGAAARTTPWATPSGRARAAGPAPVASKRSRGHRDSAACERAIARRRP